MNGRGASRKMKAKAGRAGRNESPRWPPWRIGCRGFGEKIGVCEREGDGACVGLVAGKQEAGGC